MKTKYDNPLFVTLSAAKGLTMGVDVYKSERFFASLRMTA